MAGSLCLFANETPPHFTLVTSELVGNPKVEIPTVALIIDHLARVIVAISGERTIRQVLCLKQDRQPLQYRAILEFIADLRVEDTFRLGLSEIRIGREAGDLTEELRTVAIADTCL